MNQNAGRAIPIAAIVFLTVSNTVFYCVVFIACKIAVFYLNLLDKYFLNLAVSLIPIIFFQYTVYFWSKSWQRNKLGKAVKLGATPLGEQLPYLISFAILYAWATSTIYLINKVTIAKYFPDLGTGFFMAIGLLTALTVRSWEVFLQEYRQSH